MRPWKPATEDGLAVLFASTMPTVVDVVPLGRLQVSWMPSVTMSQSMWTENAVTASASSVLYNRGIAIETARMAASPRDATTGLSLVSLTLYLRKKQPRPNSYTRRSACVP